MYIQRRTSGRGWLEPCGPSTRTELEWAALQVDCTGQAHRRPGWCQADVLHGAPVYEVGHHAIQQGLAAREGHHKCREQGHRHELEVVSLQPTNMSQGCGNLRQQVISSLVLALPHLPMTHHENLTLRPH